MNSFEFNKKLQQGRYFMQLHQHEEALEVYAQLAKEFPRLAFLWDEYGRAAATAGDYDLAGQIWEKVLDLEPKTAALLLRIAGEYGKIWQFNKVRALSRQAADLEPNNLGAQINLASLLARSGGTKEAREVVNKCLGLDPHHQQARCFAAHLSRRENKLDEAEQQFQDLLSSNLRDSYSMFFCRAELARIFDRTGRFDDAMVYLREAKQLASKTIQLDQARATFDERRERMVRKARALPKNILETWRESFPAPVRKAAPPLAFLGGHARSGTTLLERILDAHPSVVACDESLAFMSVGPLIDVTLPEIPAERLNFIRQRYLLNLTKELESPLDGKILLDKNPSVTAYLPAFLRAFPELRVLIALRDPRDVLVSCYFEDIVQLSHLSFENLAQLYSCVMDVWLAVREWKGLDWIQTRYEDTVLDLQKEGSRVTQFLGLEWHEGQAHFHDQNREKPVMSTANYDGVARPVYSRSVGRWHAYERYLAPALPALEPYCKEFGYK